MAGSLLGVFVCASPLMAFPQAVRFKTKDGWTIAALYQAPKPGKPVVILIHGVAAGKGEYDRFAGELWKLGLGTLALDLRGHGESIQGPRGPSDFRAFDAVQEWPRAEEDIEAALRFLKRRHVPLSRVGLIGASIGANLASQAAVKNKAIPWIVLLSPGQDYRGVPVSDLRGRKVLVAASATDPYAYQTALSLADRDGTTRLEASKGHGAQMFDDHDFLGKLLGWLKANSSIAPD